MFVISWSRFVVFDMFWTCFGNVLVMFVFFLYVLDVVVVIFGMFGAGLGYVWDMFGKWLGRVLDLFFQKHTSSPNRKSALGKWQSIEN